MSSDIATIVYIINIGDRLYESIGLFIIILSTIGNLCNCFVFLLIPALNKHPNALFLIGTSIGSLLFINIGLSSAVIRVLSGIDPLHRWLFFCKISTWLSYSGGCFSFMCSCFAALGQFLITSPKIKCQRFITRIRAQLIILCLAIMWLGIFIPLPIFYNHIPTSSTNYICTSSVSMVILYGTYWIIIGYYFLPVVLILILFLLTWYNLNQLLRRRRTLEGAVTRMMLIQMSILLISGIPGVVYFSYILGTQYTSKTPLRLAYEYLILLILTLFTFFTNGISFWIYLFASKTFRKHIKEFIFKWKLFKHRIIPFSIPIIPMNAPH